MSTFPQYAFKNINASGTTVVSKGPGVLHTVCVNTTSSTGIAIYDGTTLIATLGSTLSAGSNFTYDVRFNSLSVIVGGNQDITLSIG
jgi:hypothetical protein